MFLRNKIIYGYAISLGITFFGMLGGVAMGNYYHQNALQRTLEAAQEKKFLDQLQLDILYNRPAKQLSPYLNDPEGFRRESGKLLERLQKILALLETHDSSRNLSTINGEKLQSLLKEYELVVKTFSQEARKQINQLELLTASPETLKEAELQLVKLVQTKSFVKFIEFPDRLWPHAQFVDQLERDGRVALNQARLIRNQIVIASSIFSALIAALFAAYASREIALEQSKANQILQDSLIKHQRSEAALQKSEAHLRAIVSAIPDILMRINRAGIYLEFVANPSFHVVGNLHELVGTHVYDSLPPNLAQKRMEYILLAMETNSIQVYEQDLFPVDGRMQIEEVRIVPYSEDEVLALIRDITDRKQAEASLKQSELTNRVIVETMPDLLIRMDRDGQYLHMSGGSNVYVKPLLNLTSDKSDLHSILPAEMAEERLCYTHQALESGSLQIYEQIFDIDGDIRHEEVRIAPLNDREVLIIIRDITDRKQAEQQLQQLNQSLETKVKERTTELQQTNEELLRATRLKDEFLANMSHELRTPLNAILGITEGLQEQVYGDINARQLKALQTIESSSYHLLELINDILDLAKIEAGHIELERNPTSISHLCQSSMSFVKQQAMQKRIQLDIKLQLNLPHLFVDERRIRQVLINLLNNAVKFTPTGGQITLEVTRLPTALNTDIPPVQQYLRISVIDTGIGISPENIKKLFQPFIQIDSALNRQYEGTGLGLALAKRMVELHGGKVGLTSEFGVGSCFMIDLPYTFSSELSSSNQLESNLLIDSPSISEAHSPSSLILLVEDNEANIITTASYLEVKGYRVLLAKNGQEAIALAKSDQPDIILMDIQMPVMDGLEATKQIRLDPDLINVPIIAMTALAMTGDREKCLKAGVNEYLTKPVKLKQLANTIQQLLKP